MGDGGLRRTPGPAPATWAGQGQGSGGLLQNGLPEDTSPRAPRGQLAQRESQARSAHLHPYPLTLGLPRGLHGAAACTGLGECKCLQGCAQLARSPGTQEARDPTGSGAPTPPKKKNNNNEREAGLLIFKDNFES